MSFLGRLDGLDVVYVFGFGRWFVCFIICDKVVLDNFVRGGLDFFVVFMLRVVL